MEARVKRVCSRDQIRTSCTHERTCVRAPNALPNYASQFIKTKDLREIWAGNVECQKPDILPMISCSNSLIANQFCKKRIFLRWQRCLHLIRFIIRSIWCENILMFGTRERNLAFWGQPITHTIVSNQTLLMKTTYSEQHLISVIRYVNTNWSFVTSYLGVKLATRLRIANDKICSYSSSTITKSTLKTQTAMQKHHWLT